MTNSWQGKQTAIIGAARQGLALARYLLNQGAHVVLTDRLPFEQLASARQALADILEAGENLTWVTGGHPFSILAGLDILFLSGGASPDLPIAREAARRGIALSNDSQVFLEAAPCQVIGITGSAGKTTTTTLVGRMATSFLQGSNPQRRVWVGGNIGSPLIANLDQMHAGDLAVMELSSFQLEIMTRAPQVAAVLNITPNHLDRHGTMEVYTAAKANILIHQDSDDSAILGRDDPGAWSLAPQVQGRLWSFGFSELPGDKLGAYAQGESILLRQAENARGIPVLESSEIALRGLHNRLNVMAACAIAAAAGLPIEAMRTGVSGFTGVAHRLEYVRTWGGADWYNDSIATAPERAMAAVRSFDEPLVLLAGGRDKNLPWEDFVALIRRRVDHLVVFGEAAEIILQTLDRTADPGRAAGGLQSISRCADLRQAVNKAAALVQPGDVVLLSPGGTSFDEFQDFEERGVCFAQLVNDLP